MNRPQLKQPTRLEEMDMRLHIDKYRGKCGKWRQDLLEAVEGDGYWNVSDTVLCEYRDWRRNIDVAASDFKITVSSISKNICQIYL
jgi:hypothetical protein